MVADAFDASLPDFFSGEKQNVPGMASSAGSSGGVHGSEALVRNFLSGTFRRGRTLMPFRWSCSNEEPTGQPPPPWSAPIPEGFCTRTRPLGSCHKL